MIEMIAAGLIKDKRQPATPKQARWDEEEFYQTYAEPVPRFICAAFSVWARVTSRVARRHSTVGLSGSDRAEIKGEPAPHRARTRQGESSNRAHMVSFLAANATILLALTSWSSAAAAEGSPGLHGETTAISFVGCNLLASWDSEVISDAAIVVREGRVESIVRDSDPPITLRKVSCNGAYMVPAFWNSHVHLLDFPPDQDDGSAQVLMGERFLRWGFAHLIDTGSDLAATLTLADRIDQGAVRGPSVSTTGMPFVARNGTPFYAEPMVFPELTSAEQARQAVSRALADGAFAVKVMTVSLSRGSPLPYLDDEILVAVVNVAHSRGALVLAHPTNIDGIERALRAGVDVLLHTTPADDAWSGDLVGRLVEADIALAPTLMLWGRETRGAQDLLEPGVFMARAREQLSAFHAAGGKVLFGTDAGYMTDYDPRDEYRQMSLAGLSPRDILRSLTAEPARLFSDGQRCGCIRPAEPADFLLLTRNPLEDVEALAGVESTWRDGREVYGSRHLRPEDAPQMPSGGE